MAENECPRKTCLYEKHVASGARMVPFGGFLMPVQYAGIIHEHTATRTESALFDTCHMGEFHVAGPTAIDDLERLVSCDVASLSAGRCRYGFLCNERGGVIDDLVVYRLAEDACMLVVNAGTQDDDFEWVRSHVSPETEILNRSDETAKVDLQGPGSAVVMEALMAETISDMKFYTFKENVYQGERVLVSRTGYTGELGFEIYCTGELANRFWDDCLSRGVVPAGLGARDTLRLEMGMPLYGHELDENRNPAETGFARAVSSSKPFIGSDAVRDPARRTANLVGLMFEGRRAARRGDTIANPRGAVLGAVTSGSFAPSLGRAVALGYVPDAYAVTGTHLLVQTARQPLPAVVTDLPFYRDGTARKPLRDFL